VTRGLQSHNLAVTMAKTSLGTPEAEVTDDSGAVAYSKSGKPVQGEAPGRQAISACSAGLPRCRRRRAAGRVPGAGPGRSAELAV